MLTINKINKMDNKVFNVNGRLKEQLSIAIRLILLDEYGKTQKVKGWYYSKKKGLVLTWHVGDKYKATPFTDRMGKPSEISEAELVDILWNWLESPEAKEVELEEWDENANEEDDDISTEIGWRLYVDKWGHVDDGGIDHYSICAFKLVYLWYGK
jgi:hypothetical protein